MLIGLLPSWRVAGYFFVTKGPQRAGSVGGDVPTFEMFLRHLQEHEGEPVVRLASRWDPSSKLAFSRYLKNLYERRITSGLSCKVRKGDSNQSIGNTVARLVGNLLTDSNGFKRISSAAQGYPDCALAFQNRIMSGIALELKATSNWVDADSNRRVLLSSTNRLRSLGLDVIRHAVVTAVYGLDQRRAIVRVNRLRIDLIEPDSQVTTRLECAVSHKLLSRGTHTTYDI